MSRLQPVQANTADADTQALLSAVEKKLGMVPNMISTMAQSLPVAKAYLAFSDALSGSSIRPKLREQISIAVGATNGCNYCLAAHSAIGKSVGLSDCELVDAQSANATDSKSEVALQFARSVADSRGGVSDDDFEKMRAAGYGDSEIADIIGLVALNTFTNFFNRAAQTEIDFPAVPETAC